MTIRWVFGLFFIALVGAVASPSEQDDGRRKIQDLMNRKLKHTQKVLEGVALGNFDMIANNAEELTAASKAAEWHVVKTPKYELYSNDFRRLVEMLRKEAKDKNLDGAALAYVELTLNCVKCHKYVRETRDTAIGRPDF